MKDHANDDVMSIYGLTKAQRNALEDWYLFEPAGLAWMARKNKKDVNPCMYVQHHKRQGYTVNMYRSGEITGARFVTGLEGLFPKAHLGIRVTEKLSQSGKSKIRRAIQNSEMDFKCLMTVTFDPKMSELDNITAGKQGVISPLLMPGNKVSQQWAKEKFKKFINTIKVTCDRRASVTNDESRKVAYVWVAELQENENIHFHVLLNQRLPIAWLTKIWAQSNNSIDVKSVKNQNHAGCYLRKYITKGQSIITGNRYGISQNLRETMRPIKESTDSPERAKAIAELIQAMKEDIESNGGKVIDCGFYIPEPCRPVLYKKNGKIRKTKGVNGQLGPFIIKEVMEIIDPIPF